MAALGSCQYLLGLVQHQDQLTREICAHLDKGAHEDICELFAWPGDRRFDGAPHLLADSRFHQGFSAPRGFEIGRGR